MVPLYLLVLPITLAEYVYYEAHDPHHGVKIFGFVMAALCGAALLGYAGWVVVRRRRRQQRALPALLPLVSVRRVFAPSPVVQCQAGLLG